MTATTDASRRFADRLFARFPAWRPLAQSDAAGGMVLDVPSPTGDPERALRFWIERGVPSVGVGSWHSHEDLWPSESEFLAFVADVVSDRAVFVAGDGETWSCIRGEPLEDEIADVLTAPGAPDEIRVISWSGAADRVVRLADLSHAAGRAP